MAAVKTFIIAVVTAMAFTSCKKDYACVCSNPGGEYTAFKVKASMDKAQTKCEEYYNTNFGSVPWSESHCEIR